jgi:hypothetical protein
MGEINDTFQVHLNKFREKNTFGVHPIKLKDGYEGTLEKTTTQVCLPPIHIDGENEEDALRNAAQQPQEEKFILNLVLDDLDEKNLSDAADDADAIRHLTMLKRRD